jgi:hypothetical protein
MRATRILTLVLSLAAAAAVAASAKNISLELGGVIYDFNALSAAQGPSGTATNVYDLTLDPYVNGSYSLKLNEKTKLKFGLLGEFLMGTNPGFVTIGRGEPYADLSFGSLSARVSFPMYLLGYSTSSDPSFKQIGYILDKTYKGVSLSTVYGTDTTFLFTNYESLAYRIAFSKTLALVLSASTEIGLSPALWIYDVKPQASLIWGPVQLDLKQSIYFADRVSEPSFSDANYHTRFYTEPKVSFNFGALGVKGLKAYLAASLFLLDIDSSGTEAWYGTSPARGSSITPGLIYSKGPFSVEASFKYSNYDKTFSADGADPTFDPMVKFSYTLSF